MKKRLYTLMFLAVMMTAMCPAQGIQSAPDSCQQFVQEFYDWYVPKLKDYGNVVKERRHDFSRELGDALIDDANPKYHTGSIDGLDWDPFLSGQDPSPQFRVQNTEMHGNRCTANVYGWEQDTRQEHVMPKLMFVDGHWQFVNFYYPAQNHIPAFTLLQNLKQLREERRKEGREK